MLRCRIYVVALIVLLTALILRLGAATSSSSGLTFAAGSSSEQTADEASSSNNGLPASHEETKNAEEVTEGVSSTNSNEEDKDLNGEVSLYFFLLSNNL